MKTSSTKSLSIIGILLSTVLVIGLFASCRTKETPAQPVTFDQLFNDPGKYSGKYTTIEGFYFQGFEVNVLSEKLEYSGYAPGHLVPKGKMIWIEGGIPKEVFDRLRQQEMLGPTERYGKVRITGKLDYGGKYGHLGGYSSQITPSEVQLLP